MGRTGRGEESRRPATTTDDLVGVMATMLLDGVTVMSFRAFNRG